MTVTLESYVAGAWVAGTGKPATLHDATTEAVMAQCSSEGVDFRAAVRHARDAGGPALRRMTFAERGAILKELSGRIHAHRDELIELSIRNAGTTRSDAKFDVDGATGTLAAYAYTGQALGARTFLPDGDGVQLGRTPRFWGQHVLVPRTGVAVHINAFNFPAWNMLEKAACALLAGMPVIEKPGTPTALVAWRLARIVVETGLLPEGAWQFVAGSAGDLLDHLGPQDVIAFTGSSGTGLKLRQHANVARQGVRLNLETDSLNAAVLGPDVDLESATGRAFLANVVLDVRQKTGQKCTAVRRILVPTERAAAVRDALVEALRAVKVGDPGDAATTMGPLASASQRKDVREGIGRLAAVGTVATGGAEPVADKGYFVNPTLVVARDANEPTFHELEVFGPVASLLPYDGSAERAAEIVARGDGSLVTSIYADDASWSDAAVAGMAPWSGRIWIGSEKMTEQAIAPGTVLPQMTHGGPGRAGGGEELGGVRGLALYLQRTALQGFKGHLQAYGVSANT